MSWNPDFTLCYVQNFQLVWKAPALVSTSKHSGHRSTWQAFIVLVAFLLLSDSMSKHICLAVQVICACVCVFFLFFFFACFTPHPSHRVHVALNLCREIMFVKLLWHSGRITGLVFQMVVTVWRPCVWNTVLCLFSLVDVVCTGFTVHLLKLWTDWAAQTAQNLPETLKCKQSQARNN